jgi:hypothetical protein
MEEQENLETIGIGTKEQQKLEPKAVKIVNVKVESVGDKGAKKLVCEVKHPDKQETIQISSSKVEKKGKLEVGGLWVNLDEDKLIKKNSTLAFFLSFVGAKNIRELEGKEVKTIEDDSGYLAFKAY